MHFWLFGYSPAWGRQLISKWERADSPIITPPPWKLSAADTQPQQRRQAALPQGGALHGAVQLLRVGGRDGEVGGEGHHRAVGEAGPEVVCLDDRHRL